MIGFFIVFEVFLVIVFKLLLIRVVGYVVYINIVLVLGNCWFVLIIVL